MKAIYLSICLALASVQLLSAQVRNLPQFSAIHVATGIGVTLTKSNQTKVDIDVENCSPEDVMTEVRGDKLMVRFVNDSNRKNRGRKATLMVYYQSLEEIEVSSGASIESTESIQANELEIQSSSGGHINLKVEAAEMDIDVSSGGVVKMQGHAKSLKIDVSSGGVISAEGLDSDYVDADASSGGVAKFGVAKSLAADASSGGSIRYSGNPEKLNVRSSVSGSIKAE